MKQTYNVKFKIGDEVYHSVKYISFETEKSELSLDLKPYKVTGICITHTANKIDITYCICPVDYKNCNKGYVQECQLFASLEEAKSVSDGECPF